MVDECTAGGCPDRDNHCGERLFGKTFSASRMIVNGRYITVERIGGSEGNATFLANDRIRQHRCILRIMPPFNRNAGDGKNIRMRYALLKKLLHPSLARILDLGEITQCDEQANAGSFFVIEEHVNGQKLGEWLQSISDLAQRHASAELAFIQVLGALRQLHRHSISFGKFDSNDILVRRGSGGFICVLTGIGRRPPEFLPTEENKTEKKSFTEQSSIDMFSLGKAFSTLLQTGRGISEGGKVLGGILARLDERKSKEPFLDVLEIASGFANSGYEEAVKEYIYLSGTPRFLNCQEELKTLEA